MTTATAVGRQPSRRRKRGLVGAAVLSVAALTIWLVVGWDHIVTPDVDDVGPVDAVFVIGPAETRMPHAMDLMGEAEASLLLSTTSVDPETGQPYPRDYCGLERAAYRIECVIPEPYSTTGEARLLGERAEAQGWSRVAVITSTPHAARTRLLMERCTDAEVLIWTVDDDRDLGGWAREFAYQSAAWVKTQVVRGC
ncbi:hypothetical protein [Ornithinimicrobium cryptoxanthini]|uniref:hypothetical protein n=1 Tax=Ornithinimicrobium cryptoxanthini TaxID=2934161 RepID=UPI002118A613|nr:hypothetical protein [Ornithinimicrobium cryptoxanthini]